MIDIPDCYAIIPARYESSRFPGKPLAPILGKPMFWHVYQKALQCSSLKETYLATDDERICQEAAKLNVPFVMTDPGHRSGSDRILEAVQKLNWSQDSVIMNIQGDEPTLNPIMLKQLISPFRDPKVLVSTLACPITSAEADNPNKVKVVCSSSGQALYFSRSKIPYSRDGKNAKYLCHIGLYSYRFEILKRFCQLQESFLEDQEKLEQLRFLEADIPIKVVITKYQSYGVDRPEDIPIAEKLLLQEKER